MEKNLTSADAAKKFKDLVESIKVCMFITDVNNTDHTRPMATVEVENDGTLWFFTDARSIKVKEVSDTPNVHLVYAHPGQESYLDVWGNATVTTDKSLMKQKWSPVVKVYFPDGLEDPNLALLSVKPSDVYYWDSGTGKMAAMLKMAASLVTGNPKYADAEEGRLNVK